MRHVAYQRIGRTDDEPEDEYGLTECLDCNATGGTEEAPCVYCSGKRFFLGEEPMTAQEYDKLISDMRAPA